MLAADLLRLGAELRMAGIYVERHEIHFARSRLKGDLTDVDTSTVQHVAAGGFHPPYVYRAAACAPPLAFTMARELAGSKS